ncbi:MAG: hypothetical protein HYY81_11085 [Deltaproteobacteria bacterium]|nr:hypothetical protein [Deltaproteobacteria bacterium]
MGETSQIQKETIPGLPPATERQLVAAALGIVKAIPHLEIKEVRYEPKVGAYRPDFVLLVSHARKKFQVIGEVKSTGEPSILRRSGAWLKDLLTKTKHDYAVIIAPFISREGAEICNELGVGFIDLSGNCLLNLEGLYIERTGYPNKFKKPREIQSLFSPKSSRVIRWLLTDPKRVWTLKGLAIETGVSIGLIHRIATALENNLFAQKELRAFKLEDPARLLEAWREEYFRRAPKWARYVIRAGPIEESANELKVSANLYGVRYALSGPSGAWFISSYLVPTVIHCYVDVLKEEFLNELKADPVSSEGNLLIRVVEQENEFIGSRLIKGVYVVSDLQLYLDLWAMGGRGQEAAEELRKERLGF